MSVASYIVNRPALLARLAHAEQERLRCVALQTASADLFGAHRDLAALIPFPDFAFIEQPDAQFSRTLPPATHTARIGRFGRMLNTSSASAALASVHVALSQFAAISFYNCGGLAIRNLSVLHGETAQLVLSVQLLGMCPSWTWPDTCGATPAQQTSLVHRVLGIHAPTKIGTIRTGAAATQPLAAVRVPVNQDNEWVAILRHNLAALRPLFKRAGTVTAQVRDGHAEVELYGDVLCTGVEQIFSEQFVRQFAQLAGK